MSPVLKPTNICLNQSPGPPLQTVRRWTQVNRALLFSDMSYLHLTAWALYGVSVWVVAFTKHSKVHLVSVTPWGHLTHILKRLRYCSSLSSEWEKTTNFSGGLTANCTCKLQRIRYLANFTASCSHTKVLHKALWGLTNPTLSYPSSQLGEEREKRKIHSYSPGSSVVSAVVKSELMG